MHSGGDAPSRGRIRRFWWIAPLALIAGALAAPFIGAQRFAAPIQRDLEQALGRKVQVRGEVRFRVLPRPGFSIEDPGGGPGVVVEEAPAYGVEPFAYVETLNVSISLPALLTGRIRVSGIQLLNPSVNFTRQTDQGWNVQSLLSKAVARKTDPRSDLPSIEISGGRLNFKTGETKSVFYLAESEVTVEPDTSDPDRLGLRIEGEPARTDRSARGFGRLSGRGTVKLNRDADREAEIAFGVSVERMAFNEIAGLMGLRSAGLGGLLATDARLAGPVSNISIEGRIQFDEFERFRWLLPRSLERSVEYRGRLDIRSQQLLLETPPRPDAPASMRLRAAQLFAQPRWAGLVTVREAPLAAMAPLLRALAPGAVPPVPAEGSASGAIGFSGAVAQGAIRLKGLAVKPPEFEAPVSVGEVTFRIHGKSVELTPVSVRIAPGQEIRVEAVTDPVSGLREVRMQTLGIAFPRWKALWKALAGVPLDPLFDRIEDGRWSGSIRFAPGSAAASAWSGNLRIADARIGIAGLADPVRVTSAALGLAGGRLSARQMSGTLGKVRFAGDYDYDVARARPHRLDLALADIAAGDLEAILLPALGRRLTLLDRALRREGAAPDWLESRRLDIALRATALGFGDVRLENFRSRMSWDGPKLALRDVTAQVEGAALSGNATISLQRAEPAYEGKFSLKGLAWSDGQLSAEATITSRGAGREFARNAAAEGSFQVRGANLSGHAISAATGRFEWSVRSGAPQWSITGIEASIGGEPYEGQAATADQRLTVDLTGPKPLRLIGRASGARVEFGRQ